MKVSKIVNISVNVMSALFVLATVYDAQAANWAPQSSYWDGEVLDYTPSEVIYHWPISSETNAKGYSCWCGLWLLTNGIIQSDFTAWDVDHLEGDGNGYSRQVIESIDVGQTWTDVVGDIPRGINQLSRGMVLLPDTDGSTEVGYTLVRPYWPAGVIVYPDPYHPDWPFTAPDGVGYTVRSIDGGNTWVDQAMLPGYPEIYRRVLPSSTIREVILGDGTKALLQMGGIDPPGELPAGYHIAALMTKQIWLSTDQGRSWGEPIELMPHDQGFTEESDFVQMPNGDLLWVHRVAHFNDAHQYIGSSRMQSYCIRNGNTFVPQRATPLPWLHSGFPNLLRTREGIVLAFATPESHWTADYGQTWHILKNPNYIDYPIRSSYYPMSVQLDNGKIILIGHRGSDSAPGTENQAIMLQTFRLPDGLSTFMKEDFEGINAGMPVSGFNGWTGSINTVISSIPIDSGNSALWNSSNVWSYVRKSCSIKSLVEGEAYELTATLYAPGQDNYVNIMIRDVDQIWNTSMVVMLHDGILYFMRENQELWFSITDQEPSVAMDIKMILTENEIDCYYRKNGDTDWINAGTQTDLLSLYPPDYDEIVLGAYGTGKIDSILFEFVEQEQKASVPISNGCITYIR